MGYLFVSYSRWDRKANPLIDRLLADLQAAGVELWLAPDSIPAGTDFRTAYDSALDGASALLSLWGPRSVKAHGMTRERTTAAEHGIPILSALIAPDLETLPPDLAALNQIDFTRDYESALRSLIAALPPSVKKPVTSRRAAPTETPKPRSKGYVFISYVDEDSAFVTQLRDFLRERGYGYWDYQDSDRNYHTQLFLELEEIIKGAAATISVLSPSWKLSKWAAKELIFSEEVQVPVFLVMAAMMEPTLVTAGIPYIDFTRDPAAAFARLDRALRRKGLIE